MATATERETQEAQTDGEAIAAPADNHDDGHDAETLRKIVFLNRNVAAAQAQYDRADRARKAAKEGLEEEQAILNEFIAGLDEELPLFDRKPGAEPAPADDWRANRLEALIGTDGPLRQGILQALAENDPPLLTMGDVADWSKSGKRLTDVKGIGEAKAEAIQAACEHFWNQRAVDDDADDDVNSEINAGVKEAEAQAATPSWRSVVIGDLGLEEATIGVLDFKVIPTVGELVALIRTPPEWLDDVTLLDIDAALGRFRNRRSNAEIEDIDAAMGVEVEEKPKAKRARKASA